MIDSLLTALIVVTLIAYVVQTGWLGLVVSDLLYLRQDVGPRERVGINQTALMLSGYWTLVTGVLMLALVSTTPGVVVALLGAAMTLVGHSSRADSERRTVSA